ncbi:sperm-associated antigen 7 [Drosophila sulfurigaster albostrigata]|uniref:sperm-associated antigen 7 n=1 Tax=Drosophila sulfurigaster albostrigata TaxID=89887 RepID=UPI002D21E643|nr:sperm-associated antigen 7 [Drosophila sulfurigaster albostrigata]
MDLLDSILNSMDAPPATNEQQKTLIKKQREMMERMQNKQKEELLRFRKYVEERMGRFAKDDRTCIEFQPLDKVHRSVIHEIAENGGFIAMSFGREDEDRHSVVYKKEHPPSEDEVTARRNGEGWNKDIAKEYSERRRERLAQEQSEKQTANSSAEPGCSSSAAQSSSIEGAEVKPTSNYKAKYAHLIGESAALQAARKTETNQSYGFVPSKNKKDMRSIEQTLADIQAKKRLKLQQQQQEREQEQQDCLTTTTAEQTADDEQQ